MACRSADRGHEAASYIREVKTHHQSILQSISVLGVWFWHELIRGLPWVFLQACPEADVEVLLLDLKTLESVRKCATDFKSRNLPLNLLVSFFFLEGSKDFLELNWCYYFFLLVCMDSVGGLHGEFFSDRSLAPLDCRSTMLEWPSTRPGTQMKVSVDLLRCYVITFLNSYAVAWFDHQLMLGYEEMPYSITSTLAPAVVVTCDQSFPSNLIVLVTSSLWNNSHHLFSFFFFWLIWGTCGKA
jgi:hypothetical protein